jgi:hypothetical protein
MKKVIIGLQILCFSSLQSHSQDKIYSCHDTLGIKSTFINKGKERGQELIWIYCDSNSATILLYKDHQVKVLPKTGLDSNKLAIAQQLVKLKDTSAVPVQYRSHLSVLMSDSSSILELKESYSKVQTYIQPGSMTIDCLNRSLSQIAEKSNARKVKNRKKRTKLEVVQRGKADVYFLDNYVDSKKAFGCLFRF